MVPHPDESISHKRGLNVPEGLTPEEAERFQKLQSKLARFTLYLIQAFLRTGYYTPDHPESKKAKEGLHQQFKDLFDEEEGELTFLVREEQEQKEIFVEGVLPEAQKLSRMMLKGMGEIYVPKFSNYLERKDLTGLSLKSRMEQTEFSQFIDMMSDPSQVDTRRKQDKEHFLQTFYSRGILNVSFVFNDDLIPSDRGIPWRAVVTLSRMRKDLKMIPLFQKMVRKELQALRRNLLHDALRPVRQSNILCAVLRNSDLAASSEHGEEIIEVEILSFLQQRYLFSTSKIFLREHLDLKKLQKHDRFEEKSDRLVKKICQRLKEVGTKEVEDILEEFFRNGLISLGELTTRLKNRILLERVTDKFLRYTDHFFQQLDLAKEQETFLARARSFIQMIPELTRRDRYAEILRILETLKRHFHERRMWALLAGQILEEIGSGPIPVMLKEKFLAGKKEVRAAIVPIFVSLEIGSIPPLLSILRTSQDQWVRKNACEALIQLGPIAIAHLFKELEKQEISVETTCDILRVLGEIKSQQSKAPFKKLLRGYASSEDPRLREQTLYTAYLIAGPEEEDLFLSGLEDPDLQVQKRAVWCLGMIKSPRGIEKMLELLRQFSIVPSPETDPLEMQIYQAFGNSGNLTVQGRTLEEVLVEIGEKRGMRRWNRPFQKNLLTDASLGAICEALGKIGTEESLGILSRLEKSGKSPWLPKAREALKKIAERAGRSKS